MQYNKLVRDRIPEIVKAKGGTPVFHIAGEQEYWQKLKQKLGEEVEEFMASESGEELADLWEVIDAIIAYKKFDRAELQAVREKKAVERGIFQDKIILEQS